MPVENNDSKKKEKELGFIRCPTCRSINPSNAKDCYKCGKVFL